MSTPRDIVVIGGGEHARVVMDAVLSRPDAFRLRGFVDQKPCDETIARTGVARLGSDSDYLEQAGASGVAFVLGIGAVGVSETRERIVRRYEQAGARFAAIVHAAAWVSPTARVAPGAVVLGGAQVNTGASVGAHAIVNTGAVVEHDVALGAFASASPGAVIGGGTTVGDGSYLGLGSRVRDHVRVGSRVVVAMGAVVVDSLDDGAVVAGVPARPMKKEPSC